MKTKYKITKEWLYEKYIVEKLSLREIAKIITCDKEIIRRRLKKLGYLRTLSESMKLWQAKNFKPKPDCIDCGTKLKGIKSKRCYSCSQSIKSAGHWTREKNPNWAGGKRIQYGPGWTKKLKLKIAKRDGYICQFCKKFALKGCPHHINYNKKDNGEKNLVWVHKRCNSKFNSNRDYWFQFWCGVLNLKNESTIL